MAERKHKPKVKSKKIEKLLEQKKEKEVKGIKKVQKVEKEKVEVKKEEKATPIPEAPAFKDTGYDPWTVLRFPHLAEKSMNLVEIENKLVFIVDKKAQKSQIKEAVEKGFDVKVERVNVTVTRKGHKKAYIKLHPDCLAADIATRLGML